MRSKLTKFVKLEEKLEDLANVEIKESLRPHIREIEGSENALLIRR